MQLPISSTLKHVIVIHRNRCHCGKPFIWWSSKSQRQTPFREGKSRPQVSLYGRIYFSPFHNHEWSRSPTLLCIAYIYSSSSLQSFNVSVHFEQLLLHLNYEYESPIHQWWWRSFSVNRSDVCVYIEDKSSTLSSSVTTFFSIICLTILFVNIHTHTQLHWLNSIIDWSRDIDERW